MKYYMGEYWAMMNSGDLEKVEEGKSLCLPNKNKKYRNRHKKVHFDTFSIGPSDWIRTSGLLNPIQARYQTSPHPVISLNRIPQIIPGCKWENS